MMNFNRLVTVFLVLMFSLTAFAANSGTGSEDSRQVAPREEKSENTKVQFEKLLDAYQQRLTNKNADGILELYGADPVFMPEYAPPAVGREAVRKAYEWVFATLNLNGHFIVHEAEVIGDTAWVRTNSTGRFIVIATGVEADVANSEFFLFKHENGAWKIHRYIFTASAPLPEMKKSSALSEIEADKVIAFNARRLRSAHQIIAPDYGGTATRWLWP